MDGIENMRRVAWMEMSPLYFFLLKPSSLEWLLSPALFICFYRALKGIFSFFLSYQELLHVAQVVSSVLDSVSLQSLFCHLQDNVDEERHSLKEKRVLSTEWVRHESWASASSAPYYDLIANHADLVVNTLFADDNFYEDLEDESLEHTFLSTQNKHYFLLRSLKKGWRQS